MAKQRMDPYDTPQQRAKDLETVQALRALYPPQVIEQLKGNILWHIADRLKEVGLEAESKLIGDELFTLRWFSDLAAAERVTEEQAYEFVRFFGPTGLHKTVAKVLAMMADNGRLEAWT
jgi:hypothetical protein